MATSGVRAGRGLGRRQQASWQSPLAGITSDRGINTDRGINSFKRERRAGDMDSFGRPVQMDEVNSFGRRDTTSKSPSNIRTHDSSSVLERCGCGPYAVPAKLVKRPTFPEIIATASASTMDPNQFIATRSTTETRLPRSSLTPTRSLDSRTRAENLRLRINSTKSRCLVDPRTSKHLPTWDGVTTLAIMFTAFVTPYEVSFLPSATSADDGLFLVNRFIDLIFIVDMLLAFRLIYSTGDAWIVEPRRIATNYLRGWFAIDIVSVGVSSVDILAIMSASDSAGASSLNSLRILRALRAVRLIKLVRLLRASRIFKRWESRFAINYTLLEMAKCLVAMLVFSHWAACFWALQAFLLHASPLESWMGNAGYCSEITDTTGIGTGGVSAGAGDAPSWADVMGAAGGCPTGMICRADTPGCACLPPANLYAASLYWAIMTITSIGYGDIGATPFNAAEQIACCVLMLMGGGLWGYVIGTFCGTIANLGPATREFRQNMDDLNEHMAKSNVDKELRVRLREYFFQTRHLLDASNNTRLLLMMSPKLQSEMVLDVHQTWLRSIWFLSNEAVEEQFLVRLTLCLSPMVLSPFELAPRGFLYVLCRGFIIVGGDLLVKGMTWGDDVILLPLAPSLCRPLNAKSLHYSEVYIASWPVIDEALMDFPRSAHHIRRCALRLAMRRQLVRAARLAIRLHKTSMMDLTAEDVDGMLNEASVPFREATREATSSSPTSKGSRPRQRKNKTIKQLLADSTVSTDAEMNLQKHLIGMRHSSGSNCSPCIEKSPAQLSSPQGSWKTGTAPGPSVGWEGSRRAPSTRRNSHEPHAAAPAECDSSDDEVSGAGDSSKSIASGYARQIRYDATFHELSHAVHHQGTAIDQLRQDMSTVLRAMNTLLGSNTSSESPKHKLSA